MKLRDLLLVVGSRAAVGIAMVASAALAIAFGFVELIAAGLAAQMEATATLWLLISPLIAMAVFLLAIYLWHVFWATAAVWTVVIPGLVARVLESGPFLWKTGWPWLGR